MGKAKRNIGRDWTKQMVTLGGIRHLLIALRGRAGMSRLGSE
jgi:hypothetical protein